MIELGFESRVHIHDYFLESIVQISVACLLCDFSDEPAMQVNLEV